MENKKLENFLISGEAYSFIDKIDEFLKIDPDKDVEKDMDITDIVYKYFFEKLSGESLVNYLKEKLKWLSEEEIQNLLEFIAKNLSQRREELWQEEPEEEKTTPEETYEEKEKKYMELMKTMIKKPEPFILKKEKQPEKESNIKTITFEPSLKEEQKQESKKEENTTLNWQENNQKKQDNLPTQTIIIKSKKEEKIKEDNQDIIDLSKL